MKKANIHKLTRAVDEFRKLDPQFPVQTMITFMYVATHPDCTLREVEKNCHMSQASASRNVAALGKYHRAGKEGHDLVRPELNLRDTRQHIINLTPKGRLVAASLSDIMETHHGNPTERKEVAG